MHRRQHTKPQPATRPRGMRGCARSPGGAAHLASGRRCERDGAAQCGQRRCAALRLQHDCNDREPAARSFVAVHQMRLHGGTARVERVLGGQVEVELQQLVALALKGQRARAAREVDLRRASKASVEGRPQAHQARTP